LQVEYCYVSLVIFTEIGKAESNCKDFVAPVMCDSFGHFTESRYIQHVWILQFPGLQLVVFVYLDSLYCIVVHQDGVFKIGIGYLACYVSLFLVGVVMLFWNVGRDPIASFVHLILACMVIWCIGFDDESVWMWWW
jgi:hypothetical protein